jgi:hypothetical protein
VNFIQQYPFDVPTEAFPFEIFKQAFVAVQSCVVHLQVLCCAFDFRFSNMVPEHLIYFPLVLKQDLVVL